MTKVELLADLANTYKVVGTPEPQTVPFLGVTPYLVNVFEVGLSEGNKKPVAYQKNVLFYVYNEGIGDESAYYGREEPKNTSNTDVTIDVSSYESVANLYYSTALQKKVLTAIITQCTTVFLEAANTNNHANRMKLVSAANIDIQNVIKRFMSAVAINATVQSQGAMVADSVIQAIVTGAWDSYASLIVA